MAARRSRAETPARQASRNVRGSIEASWRSNLMTRNDTAASPDGPLITGTDFVTVATRDYDSADAFYGNVLQLRRSKRWGKLPAGEFETGSLTIAVMQSDAFGMDFRANNHPIALRVRDVADARAALEARGVEFKGDLLDSGVCHQAFFEDPDGNVLALHHRYVPEARVA
jgi:catechol 2,3-dioxygenase-like lactoylglutathione lyase family enzyme